jgi:thiopeptide-type bacteriocin biosynthesis protein
MIARKNDRYQWIQLNVGLIRANGSALNSAHALFNLIAGLVLEWRNIGRLQSYFFMRKSPDVRIRFLMIDRALETMIELSQHMEILKAQGAIDKFFFSDYPAEIERFGGLEAMGYVHEYFDRDTTNWWQSQQQPTIAPEILLAAVFDDLFWQTLLDRDLVLDTWLALAAMTPLAPDTIVPKLEFRSIDTLTQDLTICTEFADILASYREANQNLAWKLISLDRDKLLIEDLTLILAMVALFNFNRHGFGGDRSSLVVASVVDSYSISRQAKSLTNLM